ncbi:tmRNA [Pseudomonas sp. Leaf127]|uniref:hypothetical protein n=1 Tax=Pseudomonas sp. Leaf127 TaxID=1736267 RepID=UPI0007039BC5|nr:hypothetical protein [Pseudomonas sp. Leaf127]KQQ67573.1 tmRNA [Pseudomonas sp. Leaf127]
MKRTALTGLFFSAALLASPVFAADDLCDTNLQVLKDAQVSTNSNLSMDKKTALKTTHDEAAAAKAAGDEKKCIELTSKSISELKLIGSGSQGAK